MPYVQIQTQALSHPKIVGLSHAAFRLWVQGLAHCQEHLTDGRLQMQVICSWRAGLLQKQCRSFRGLIAELTAAKLWLPEVNGGYLVHDYLQWNKSRAEVEGRRRFDRARKCSNTHSARNPHGTETHSARNPLTDTIRSSTDQDHRPQELAGLPQPVENPDDWPWPALQPAATRSPPPPPLQLVTPTWAHYVRIAHTVLADRRAEDTGADDVEAFKRACVAAKFAYDGRLAGQALDAAEAVAAKRARTRG